MKNIGNFLIGTLSSFGMAQALPDTVHAVSYVPSGVVDSIEALVSLLSGIVSALLVAWLKHKWDKKK